MQDLQELNVFGGFDGVYDPHISMPDLDVPNSSSEEDATMMTRSSRSTKTTSSRRKKQGRKVRKERHVIQHDYHDHAFDPVDFDEYILDQDPSSALKKKGGVGVPFPLKLHELLERAEEEGLNDIVSWQPHGRAFIVHQPKTFVTGIMHRFFRQTKLTSFQRQLNLYGFNRLTKGADSGGYYHELFVRGRPHLTNRMVRTKIKGTGFKAASNPDCEPDFYHMTPVDSPRPPVIDTSYSTGAIVSNDDSSAVVTPNEEPSIQTNCNKSLPPLSTAFDIENSNDDNPREGYHMPFLGKRLRTKRVKLGNQSFQYMEHLEPLESGTRTATSFANTRIDQDLLSISPNMFDSSFYQDSQNADDDTVPKEVDPLSVFLAEIGDDFEDDINFGDTVLPSRNSVAEV